MVTVSSLSFDVDVIVSRSKSKPSKLIFSDSRFYFFEGFDLSVDYVDIVSVKSRDRKDFEDIIAIEYDSPDGSKKLLLTVLSDSVGDLILYLEDLFRIVKGKDKIDLSPYEYYGSINGGFAFSAFYRSINTVGDAYSVMRNVSSFLLGFALINSNFRIIDGDPLNYGLIFLGVLGLILRFSNYFKIAYIIFFLVSAKTLVLLIEAFQDKFPFELFVMPIFLWVGYRAVLAANRLRMFNSAVKIRRTRNV